MTCFPAGTLSIETNPEGSEPAIMFVPVMLTVAPANAYFVSYDLIKILKLFCACALAMHNTVHNIKNIFCIFIVLKMNDLIISYYPMVFISNLGGCHIVSKKPAVKAHL